MYCHQVVLALRSQEPRLGDRVEKWAIDAHSLMWAATCNSMWQELNKLTTVIKEHVHMFVQPPSQLLPHSDEEGC